MPILNPARRQPRISADSRGFKDSMIQGAESFSNTNIMLLIWTQKTGMGT